MILTPTTVRRIASLKMPAASLRQLLVILSDECDAACDAEPGVTIYSQDDQIEAKKVGSAERMRRLRQKKASQGVTCDATGNVTCDAPPSPSPPSPDPSLPALTPARENPSEREDSPLPSVRSSKASRTAAALADAQAVDLDMLASAPLRTAWRLWQQWRSSRDANLLVGENPAPWTALAAKQAADTLTRMAAQHGEQVAIAANTEAIARRWLAVPDPKVSKPPFRYKAPVGPNHGSANQNALAEYS